MSDRIEKSIDIAAPVERVWRALTDHQEFGAWFKVALDGPFVVGELSTGQMTYPGFEHHRWKSRVEAIEPPGYFAYRWPPFYGELDVDTSLDPWTLVEFHLEPTPSGTRLRVVESGFPALPSDRGPIAFRNNEGGWTQQVKNIQAYAEHVRG